MRNSSYRKRTGYRMGWGTAVHLYYHRLCIILLRGKMLRLNRRGVALSSRNMVTLGERISKHAVLLERKRQEMGISVKKPASFPCNPSVPML